ncbi:DUF4850 domain-containing protein [Pseudoxanthomonas winnipegensis]|nr:DUF4850 domain-containing protein [Pseudoxanthomonas winnipegensis]
MPMSLPSFLRPCSGLLLLLLASLAQAEVYRLDAPPERASADATPRSRALGELTLNNGVRLPAMQLIAVDPMEDSGWSTADAPPLTLDATLAPALAARLTAWSTPRGWLLVPRGWQPVRGALGVDGSASIAFLAEDGQGEVSLYDAGACVGCAVGAASAFFAQAREQGRKEDFFVYEGAGPDLKTTALGPHTLGYHSQAGALSVDGLAWFDGKADLPYHDLRVRLPPDQHALARAILDWRLPEKDAR